MASAMDHTSTNRLLHNALRMHCRVVDGRDG